MKLQKFIFLLMLLIFTASVVGVKAQPSKGGVPPSFTQAYMPDESNVFMVPAPDVRALRAEDEQRSNFAPRLAVVLPVDLSPCNSGEWTTLESGETVWQLAIEAPGARALLLTYSNFNLPKGSKLYIYNKARTQVLGAYTEENNPIFGTEFSTEMVNGDYIILEYVAPRVASNLQKFNARTGSVEIVEKAPRPIYPDIQIEGVSYVYNDLSPMADIFDSSKTPSDLGMSGSCQVNVNCAQGAQWQNEKKGVAATLQRIGSYWYICSGSLINNLKEDLTPYFLMAWHCSEDDDGARPTTSQYNQWQFYFHWERTGCANTSPLAQYRTITGCQWVAESSIYGGSDGLLIRFNQPVPVEWDVFYNGWDATGFSGVTLTTTQVGIHHPEGDIKKISTASGNTTSTTWTGGINSGHWSCSFNPSATEGGSSGSPLFNPDKNIIGTLTGGNSSCSNASGSNIYGKMGYHFDRFNTVPVMKPFLDPDDTGERVCEGRYTGTDPIVNFTASTRNPYAMQPVQFYSQSFYATSYQWSFPGGNPSTSTEQNPIVVYAVPGGPHDVSLTINGNLTKLETGYINCTEKLNETIIEIGAGTSTANHPIGWANNNACTHTASLYTAAQIGGPGTLHSIGWRTNTARTVARTIRVWMEYTTETDVQGVEAWEKNAVPNETATLVAEYFSQTNLAGWNTWEFNKSIFDYNGTDNVIIYVEALGTANANNTTATRYTTTGTNTNRTWSSNATTEPTGTPTTNAQVPNIQLLKKTPSEMPVANFTGPVRVNPEMEENFDVEEDFLPEGWTKLDVSGSNHWSWESGGHEGSPGCAARNYTASGTQNSWLVTPAIQISSTGYKLEFYSLVEYLSYYTTGGSRIHVSTTDTQVGSFVLLKQFASDELTEDWFKYSFSLDNFVGETIYIGFQYTGTDAHNWFIDDVVIGVMDPLGTFQIYRDQILYLEDLSTGPPVVWDWQFPGSNTPLVQSFEDIPEVTYPYAGTYDIGLSVTNLNGSNNIYKPEILIVKDRAPKVNFAVKGGYDALGEYIDEYHSFIPPGSTIKYTDLSEQLPNTYKWTFAGGNPASSTSKNETVFYKNEGEYSTSLTVKNSAGESTKFEEDLVYVGYGPENISNCNFPGTSLGFWTFGTNLYVFGSNNPNASNNGWTQIAERFKGPNTAGQITSVLTLVGGKGTGSKEYTLDIVLPGETGNPDGDVLYTSTFNINEMPAIGAGGTLVNFEINPPVLIPEGQIFFIRMTGFVAHNAATRLYFAGSMGDSVQEGEVSTCVVYQFISNTAGSVWTPISDVFVGEPESSAAWWPEFTYTQIDVNQLLTLESAAGTKLVPVTSNVTYTAETEDTWFTVTVVEGGVNVQYQTNTGTPREGSFTISGGGVTRVVNVLQAFEALSLNVTPETQVVPCEAGDVTFFVTSNVQWEGACEELWVIIESPKNVNNATLIVTVDENLSLDSRSAEITISGGDITKTVTLIQEGKELFLEIDPTGTIQVDKMDGSRSIAVSSNSSWYAVSDVAWINFTEQAGELDGTVYFNFNANPSNVTRTAIISVKAGTITKTLTVVQAAGTSMFTINPNILQLSSTASSATFEITSPIAWEANVPEDAWYSLSTESGAGNATVTVNYTANLSDENRISEIVFNDGIVYRYLQLNQRGSAQINLATVANGSIAVFEGTTPVTNGSYVDLGTILTVVATPNTGYVFNTILVNGLPYANTFLVTGTTTIGAVFELEKYAITYEQPINGTLTVLAVTIPVISGTHIAFNTVLTITATPNTNYHIGTLTVNGAPFISGGTHTVVGATVIVCTFEEDPKYILTLTADPEAGGTPSGAGSYYAGEVVQLNTTVNEIYTFTGWYDGTTLLATTQSYDYTMPASAKTITAKFALVQYQVTYNTPANGTLTVLAGTTPVTSGTDVDHGTVLTITAVANENYHLSSLTINGDPFISGDAYTVVSTINIVCTFTEDGKFGLTLLSNPASVGILTGGGDYFEDEVVPINATSNNSNYEFVEWLDGQTQISQTASFNYTMPAESKTLTARFQGVEMEITATASPASGGEVAGAGLYRYNTSATLIATANEHYSFANWTENGEVIDGAGATYTFTVLSPRTLVANFVEDAKYVLTLTADPAAGGTPSGAGSYYAEEVVSLNTTVNDNYTFTGWYDGTTLLAQTQVYSYTMPALAKTITAKYALNQFQITYSTPANGTLTVLSGTTPVPTGTMVDYGTVLTITATANDNYHLGTLTVNGTPFTSGGTHTVVAATVIVCTFEEDAKYILTLEADPVAGGTPSGAGSYYAAEVVSINTTLNNNYTFKGWYDGTTLLAETQAYSYTMPASNKTITAKYALVQFEVTYNTPDNGTLTVLDGTTPVPSGTMVDYGTVLTITADPDTDYILDVLTVNDEPFVSGDDYTVVSETVIVCSFESVSIRSEQVSGFTLYPNPVKDILTIVRSTNGNARIEVYSANGLKVWTSEVSDSRNVVNVSSFPSGIYMIRVIEGRGVTTQKFVKE